MPDAPRIISIREPLPATLPVRRSDLEVAEFDTELVVWDPVAKMVHHLHGVAAILFDACDGLTPSSQLIGEIQEATGLSRAVVDEELTTVWQMFNRRSLFALPPGVTEEAKPAPQARQRRRRRA